jgi:hypothetical protein
MEAPNSWRGPPVRQSEARTLPLGLLLSLIQRGPLRTSLSRRATGWLFIKPEIVPFSLDTGIVRMVPWVERRFLH